MASLDPNGAYFSIQAHNTSTKYLKFQLQGQTFKFLTLPLGIKIFSLDLYRDHESGTCPLTLARGNLFIQQGCKIMFPIY